MPAVLETEKKTCRKCDTEKPLTDFFRDASTKDGRHTRCKSCHSASAKRWVRANPEKRREYKKTEYARHRDTVRARNKRWYERHRGSEAFLAKRKARSNTPEVRDTRFRREYGISLAEVEAMAEAQGGVCAICKEPERLGEKGLCVDHCHQTGRVRGMLCHKCNRALGLFNDTIAYLNAAATYLKAI